ncbi:MAG: TIGR03943 family protein [Anaerolineae bacterium]|nr:TIGR03943 family protein [Anaerolineae bacterium]
MQLPHAHEHDHDHGQEQLQAWIKAALLVGLGVYFIWIIVTGNVTNYINTRFAWLSYVAAAIFLVLGAWGLINAARAARHEHEHHDHEHEHDHDHSMSWGILAVIAIPLVVGTLIPSRPLGAEAISGDIAMTNSAAAANVTTFTINPLDRNVLDWLRVFSSTSDYQTLNGEPASLIGFVYREASFAEDQFMIARYSISCCVADASALGIPVMWADTAALDQGQWVHVQGSFQVADFRGDELPVLQAETIELVDQPEHPYLYP